MPFARIVVINGPNLNLLGLREPGIYGAKTLADIEAELRAGAGGRVELQFRQSNSEGELVGFVQEAGLDGAGIILNAGAYTHTSVALADAVKASRARMVEVHLSNVHARESFRHHSYLSPVAVGVIAATMIAYVLGDRSDPGLTSEIALVLTFGLGALAMRAPEIALGVGIVQLFSNGDSSDSETSAAPSSAASASASVR